MTGIRLTRDKQLDVASDIPALDEFCSRWANSWPPTTAKASGSLIVKSVRGRARPRRLCVGDRAGSLVWPSANHGEVVLDGGVGTIELSSDSVPQFELFVAPDFCVEPTLRIIRLITELLLAPDGAVLLHAAAVTVDESAWLFLGDSGFGKTTTARRLGREGAMRLSDDTLVLHLGTRELEPFVLDRGGGLPGRRGRTWPLGVVTLLAKGASSSQLAQPVPDPLRTWLAATARPLLPGPARFSVLEALGELALKIPPIRFDVAPHGPLIHVLRSAAQREVG